MKFPAGLVVGFLICVSSLWIGFQVGHGVGFVKGVVKGTTERVLDWRPFRREPSPPGEPIGSSPVDQGGPNDSVGVGLGELYNALPPGVEVLNDEEIRQIAEEARIHAQSDGDP